MNYHVMVKPNGSTCNLSCDYCYYLRKNELYPNQPIKMSEDVLESFTRQYLQSSNKIQVEFTWQGGEPTLMGVAFYEKALKLQRKYQPENLVIHNSIQTNGTLLNNDWCNFFKENNFLVGISLDGPRVCHDRYRHDKLGQPTFDAVMRAVDLLHTHQVEFNILTTIHAGNVNQPVQVYEFLKNEAGTKYIQFIPIIERVNRSGFQEGYQVTKRSVTSKKYGEFLIAVFDQWVRKDVGSIFVQIFDAALGAWSGRQPGLCVFCRTCGSALVMEHNGDIFCCDHFVQPDHFLGNILLEPLEQLVLSEKQVTFGNQKHSLLPDYCLECEYNFICCGGCPKDRIRSTPDGHGGLNILCEGYKAFFSHIDRPMRVMSALVRQNLPPSDIMKAYYHSWKEV